ncbi:MAG TPA: hypothetical protein VFI20_10325, partial [Terracidiphilus sp.]|nr:hypothetical protein [Terracidiphilus sp.]
MTDDTTGKSALRVHRRNWRRLAAAAGVALGLACGAPGAKAQTPMGSAARQQHMEEIVRGLHRGVTVREAAISPDGKRLAWVEGGRSGGIRVAWLDDLKKIADVTAATSTNEECREGDVIWEPDSKAVAFFSDCAGPGGQLELYVEKLDGSP